MNDGLFWESGKRNAGVLFLLGLKCVYAGNDNSGNDENDN